jgi:hypothetical protein
MHLHTFGGFFAFHEQEQARVWSVVDRVKFKICDLLIVRTVT